MSLLNKLIKNFSYDYCTKCKEDRVVIKTKIYSLPFNASHDLSHNTKFDIFVNTAKSINDISEIPTGFLGAYAKVYRCNKCYEEKESFEIFLPVRMKIVPKLNLEVKNGELNNLEKFNESMRGIDLIK